MQSPHTFSRLSRRSWLRDTAITATGAAVLPSFLTSCTDHGNLGDPPATLIELANASTTLRHMEAWVSDVYLYTGKYEEIVYKYLASGEKPDGWKDFIINVLTDIAIGLLEVAAVVSETELPFLGPVFAIAGESISKWAFGERPATLAGEFTAFEVGHLSMQKAISDMLIDLYGGESDGYKNLRARWNDKITFNKKEYLVRDLAKAKFPTKDDGKLYTDLRTAAYDRFRMYIWNLMLVKTATMTYQTLTSFYRTGGPTKYARDVLYKDSRYTASYFRCYYNEWTEHFFPRRFYFVIDGHELLPEACLELFKDDTPDNQINSNGLFSRDYVFKQFHKEKPDFGGYFELRKDLVTGPTVGSGQAWLLDVDGDNYTFNGGIIGQ